MYVIFSKESCLNCENIKSIMNTQNLGFTIKKCKSLLDLSKSNDIDENVLINFNSFPIIKNCDTNTFFNFSDALKLFDEPILTSNKNRFTIYPIEYNDIFEMYKKARASFWQPEEISLKDELNDWIKLNKNEQNFILNILAFFSASDGIVNENLNLNFGSEVQFPEARAFYTFQASIETIHSETYGLLLDKLVLNPFEKLKLQRGIENIRSIKNKAEWALKWTNPKRFFAERLIAFACVEGIMFSGSFCAIFWLKKRGIMPGLCFSNELISRDEGLHTDFAVLLYTKYIKHKISEHIVHEIVKGAVEHEKEFILESLPCKLIGMNSDVMNDYIEYVADRLLKQLGYNKIWNTQLPTVLNFMENISLEGKTNFFEKRVGEYAKAGVMNSSDTLFSIDSEF